MKKLIIGLIFSLLFAGSAIAEVKIYQDTFSVDVPNGWTEAIDDRGRIMLTPPDGNGYLRLNATPNDVATLQQVVTAMSRDRGGSTPVPSGNGALFQVPSETGPVNWYVFVDRSPTNIFYIIILTGVMEGDLDVLLPVAQTLRLK